MRTKLIQTRPPAGPRKEPSLAAGLPVLALLLLPLVLAAGCTPTVQVAMPNEPITINLNVRVEHEIRVRVDQELESVFEENDELF